MIPSLLNLSVDLETAAPADLRNVLQVNRTVPEGSDRPASPGLLKRA